MAESALAGREPSEEIRSLVDGLHYAQKVERSLDLISDALKEHGEGLVVANSLGKDSSVVWDLAKRVSPQIRGFIVTTRFKPAETVEFMNRTVERHPELRVFRNDVAIPDRFYESDPDQLLQYAEGRAHAAGGRRDGCELLGDRPPMHGRPHADRLQGGRVPGRGAREAQPDPALVRA